MHNQQILDSIISNNNAIILVLTTNSNPEEIIAGIIKKFTNYSGDIYNYSDLITLDGKYQSIKKEDIINIINQFSHAGTDNNDVKFYVLKNCEFSSKEAFNSLLKFLEEPKGNTLGILTTSSLNSLPITVRSRCNIFRLETDENLLCKIKEEFKLDSIPWIMNLFQDINELKTFCMSNDFNNFVMMHNFFMNINMIDYKQMFDQFKNLAYGNIRLLLQSLLVTTSGDKQQQILTLLEDLIVNPVRPMIFLKLIKIMESSDV